MEQQVFSVKEVARIFGVSGSTIHRSVKEGTFPPPIKIGKRRKGWIRLDIEGYFAKPSFEVQLESEPRLTYSKTWRAGHGQQKP